MPPRPFEVAVPDAVLEDLRERLARTRWPDAIPDTGWDYGADVDYVRELCEYWRDGYDWRVQERAFNRYPQFLCEVDGVDIHFYHVRGNGPAPFPLLLLHGWPGSVVEFLHLIGPLTDPAAHGGDPADSFDVVVPSLPGYGWSGKPRERGWGVKRVAAAFDTLMHKELGYERYGLQGGDWGGIISARMAAAHADHVAAAHVNFALAAPPPDAASTEEGRAALAAGEAFRARETAYSQLQSTKPMSLAVAQADSPAGLAAWITEKFRTWSDCDGDIESVYSKDLLLTNIMCYWAPNSIASAARLYYEGFPEMREVVGAKIEVPLGVAVFPKEIYRYPRSWVERHANVQHWTEFERGGHFAALEQPDALLEDVRAFYRMVR